MEKRRKSVIRIRRSLAFIMAFIMAFYMSFACEMKALAKDYGDKNLQGSDQALTAVFDPHGGVFKDDGTTEPRETIFFTDNIDNDNYYYKIIVAADIPELEERSGYVFEGWYLEGNKLAEGDLIFNDVTFAARWSEPDCAVNPGHDPEAAAGTGIDPGADSGVDAGLDADSYTDENEDADAGIDGGTDADAGPDTGGDIDSGTENNSGETGLEENSEDSEAVGQGEEISVAFNPQGGIFKDDGTEKIREFIFFADNSDNDNQFYKLADGEDIPLLAERPGYVFEGWYCQGAKLEAGSRIFAGAAFEAQWSEAVTVNLLAAGSEFKEFGEKEFTVEGEEVTLFFDPKGGGLCG